MDTPARKFLDDPSGKVNTVLTRPPVPPLNPKEKPLIFMQTDADYTLQSGDVPVIRLFGLTAESNSVMLLVYNFEPYFYVPLSQTMAFGPEDKDNLTKLLNERVKDSIKRIEKVERSSVMHYSFGKKANFLKIVTNSPKHVSALRRVFEEGFKFSSTVYIKEITYESNIPYALRFMIDRDVSGMSWIEVPAGKYELRTKEHMSTCQIEVETDKPENVLAHSFEEPEYSKIASLRIMSFDIECTNDEKKMPQPDKNEIITISTIVQEHDKEEPIVRQVFTLKKCAPIVGVNVASYANEKELLEGWQDFIQETDPDILTGYNICNFDFGYIVDRAKALKIKDYGRFSRVAGSTSKVKSTTFSSKALGTRDTKDINIEGRIQMDMMQVILAEYKLPSYTLNSVSSQFLKQQKEEVHYTMIKGLYEKDEFTRRKLAIYCLKDAYLALQLMNKLLTVYNYTEMARVTGVPVSYLFKRGQQIKVASQLYRRTKEEGVVVPTLRVEKGSGEEGIQYEGATVIEPSKGFYEKPVVTLDFASLYPSIMISHNICYTTLIPSDQLSKIDMSMVEKGPSGDSFVKKEHKEGLLPSILRRLLDARKRARDLLAKEKDPFKKAVLNGRQLALKISANSVYGFTGAVRGMLPCIAISSAVTSYGREMILQTKRLVESSFTKEKGYATDARVVYGDTDSVMILFGVEGVAEAMKLGKEASVSISKTFPQPIKLEYEKVYKPYLLLTKKRYAGLLFSNNPDKYDKLDAKGIETVRRDNCLLVKDIVNKCLDLVIRQNDKEGALKQLHTLTSHNSYCKEMISDLFLGRIDISLLIITKGIGKRTETKEGAAGKGYKAKQAHVELAARLKERDQGAAPGVGDRVAYVFVHSEKGTKGYEKSEDPITVLEKDIPIDIQYYIDHQLKRPLKRIFKHVIPNATNEIFSGDHTKYRSTAKLGKGIMGGFFTTKLTCLGCKTTIDSGAVCKGCEAKKRSLFVERMIELNEYEKKFADLWVQCQRCHESLHESVICHKYSLEFLLLRSQDCPNFFTCVVCRGSVTHTMDMRLQKERGQSKRIKVQKDLEEAQKVITLELLCKLGSKRFDEQEKLYAAMGLMHACTQYRSLTVQLDIIRCMNPYQHYCTPSVLIIRQTQSMLLLSHLFPQTAVSSLLHLQSDLPLLRDLHVSATQPYQIFAEPPIRGQRVFGERERDRLDLVYVPIRGASHLQRSQPRA